MKIVQKAKSTLGFLAEFLFGDIAVALLVVWGVLASIYFGIKKAVQKAFKVVKATVSRGSKS